MAVLWKRKHRKVQVNVMRIDAFNKIGQMYQTGKPKKTTGKAEVSFRDSLEISQVGKDFQIAKMAVLEAPDVRMDRVEAIRQQLASGTYSVTGEELADKLVERYFDHKA